MTIAIFADLSWPLREEQLWIAVAGILASGLAFLVGFRVFSGVKTDRRPAADPSGTDHDPFAAGSNSERRQSFRRKGSTVTVLIAEQHQTEATQEGWVLDRSLGGIGLYSEKPKEVGTLLRVRPENGPTTTPFIEVEVKSCVPFEDGWHLNCAFVQTPPYSVLLLLG
jgi:hypothetical protein